MLARAVPSILPPMSFEESINVTKIYSVAAKLPADTPLIHHRPFRAPHHTISFAGLVGGGQIPGPGEISLAHRGVLFLDELPEFGMRVLEVMRQPLEDKQVTISRARGTLTFPANFQLIAAMNPCPCGYYGDPVRACTCSNSTITRYQKRISGPLLDRIDIHIEVPRVDYEKLSDDRLGEPSAKIQNRVEKARDHQRARFGQAFASRGERQASSHADPTQVQANGTSASSKIACNADMRPAEVRRFCQLEEAGSVLMRTAMNQLQLSARAYHRVLKLARTIADLAGSDRIAPNHLAEALQYRQKSNGLG